LQADPVPDSPSPPKHPEPAPRLLATALQKLTRFSINHRPNIGTDAGGIAQPQLFHGARHRLRVYRQSGLNRRKPYDVALELIDGTPWIPFLRPRSVR